jgi:hypothetical protein
MSPICQFNMYQNMCTGWDFRWDTVTWRIKTNIDSRKYTQTAPLLREWYEMWGHTQLIQNGARVLFKKGGVKKY